MSSAEMPTLALYRWAGDSLQLFDDSEASRFDASSASDMTMNAADSWLVSDGLALGVDLHRARFTSAVATAFPELRVDAFWSSVIAIIPRTGNWFPRVELRRVQGAPLLALRLRNSPERGRSVRVASHEGPDPRREPTVKGPDLDRMGEVRTAVQRRGAGEAVILSPDGFVIEGAYSALVWWRGNTLCSPALDLERIDSVTAKTVLTLAQALGVDTIYEEAAPADLDGLEVWALNALQGIRVVTAWIDGPQLAEEPGRADLWRRRLGKLSRPLVTLDT